MWRNNLVFVVLFFSPLAPALADAVNVTVSGAAGGDGTIIARCLFLTDCDEFTDTESFGISGSNNHVGTFTASGSTSADEQRVSMSAFVQQITTASPTSISVDLLSSASVDALGAEWGARFSLVNSDTFEWTLTTESLMNLTTQVTESDSPNYSPCFVLMSVGPKGASFFLSACEPELIPNQSFIVAAGTYTLIASNNLMSGFSPEGMMTNDETLVDFSLTADFTPIVPEPKWSIIVPAALFILCFSVRPKMRASAFRNQVMKGEPR